MPGKDEDMTTHAIAKDVTPWYREPWPWILFGLPATAVVAGIITLVIAIKHADGLVAEDYYKQGLAINRVLERESRAAQLGLKAQFMFSADKVRVRLEGNAQAKALIARFIHPVQADQDREVTLTAIAPGMFEAQMPRVGATRWHIQLQDDDANWRLSGVWMAGEQSVSVMASAGAKE